MLVEEKEAESRKAKEDVTLDHRRDLLPLFSSRLSDVGRPPS